MTTKKLLYFYYNATTDTAGGFTEGEVRATTKREANKLARAQAKEDLRYRLRNAKLVLNVFNGKEVGVQ